MSYIHTFSMVRYSDQDEIRALKDSYREYFLYISEKNIWVLNAFLKHGLRVEISPIPNDDGERKFNKKHPQYKMKIFVTPAKLLDPSINLEGLTTKKKIGDAYYRLSIITALITEETGVDLMDALLDRIDVTEDVITPSDVHSHEIIKAAKKSINRYGYNLFSPQTHPNYKVDWREEDTMMFQNKNQHIAAKIYNKKRGLALEGCTAEVNKIGDYGLLRFELSLYRKRINEDYQGNDGLPDRLPEILWNITKDAPRLFDQHFTQVFVPGAMMPRSKLKKRIKAKYPTKQKREDMLEFSDYVTKHGIEKAKAEFTKSEFKTRLMWFEHLSMSPVCVSTVCSKVPAFSDLVTEKITSWLFKQ